MKNQSTYSYCRANKTRRKTISCQKQNELIKCKDNNNSEFTCLKKCPTEAIDGVWKCPITSIPCDKPVTISENCEPTWNFWKKIRTSKNDQQCGLNCGIYTYSYECSSGDCGPNDNEPYQEKYDIPCKLPMNQCNDAQVNDILFINNTTSFTLYAFIITLPNLSEKEVTTSYIIEPNKNITLSKIMHLLPGFNVQIGVVGDLSSSIFFDYSKETLILTIKSIVYKTNRCLDIEFFEDGKECIDEPPPVEDISNTNNALVRFVTRNPYEFLDEALLTFQDSKNLLYYKVDSTEKEGQGFKTDIIQQNFTFFKNGEFFNLYQGSDLITVSFNKRSSSLFKLVYVSGDSNEAFSFNITFFPIDIQTGQLFNNYGLPMMPENINLGIDHCRVTVLKWKKSVAELFLNENKVEIKNCCLGKKNAICLGTKYDTSDNKPFQECTVFMQDEWCKDVKNSKNPECGCFPSLDLTVEEQITRFLEKDLVPQARICTIPRCKIMDQVYVPNEYKNATCSSVCAQIQNAIVEGKLRELDFKGQQVMRCGLEGKFINLTTGQEEQQPVIKNNNLLIIISSSTSIVIVIIVVLIVYFVLKNKNTKKSIGMKKVI